MEEHKKNLLQLCRVCGQRFSRTKEKATYSCSYYADRLEATMMVNTKLDREDVHPKTFCHSCYRRMKSKCNSNWITYIRYYNTVCHVSKDSIKILDAAVKAREKGGKSEWQAQKSSNGGFMMKTVKLAGKKVAHVLIPQSCILTLSVLHWK